MRIQNYLDLQGLDLRRARVQGLSSDPSLVSADAGRFWFNTATTKLKVWNGTAAENLTNLLESVTASGALHAGAIDGSKNIALTIDAASASVPGTMSAAHYNLLAAATNTNNASSLVQRDPSGNFAAGTITANLTGTASNATQLNGQASAYYLSRANQSGTQLAATISDFSSAVFALSWSSMTAPTGPVAMGSQRITGLADPTNPQDGATKNYVDSVATGLDTKASVKAGTTAALPANTYSNGSSGVGATLTANANGAFPALDTTYTPVVNDRVLVKNEASQSSNGIYVLTNAGSGSTPWVLTRATDADTSGELTPGAFTFVEGGQSLVGSGWVVNTSTNPIVIGSTAITWAQFSGGQAYTPGNGLALNGSAFSVTGTANRIAVSAGGVDIAATYVGQTSITTLGTVTTGTWNGAAIPVANGGTGQTTATAARNALGAPGKYAAALPALTAGTGAVITHSLGTADVTVTIIDQSTFEIVYMDITSITTTQLTVTSGLAAGAGAYRIVVTG